MKPIKVLFLLLILYLLTHLIGLNKLPVFADEAIYIRWAQMIHDDPKQYAFLPLYDGKTPLFIWLLIPLVNIQFVDPVYTARLLSVLAGGMLAVALFLITKEYGGSKRASLMSALLTVFLPFTFFYSRMALIDILVTTFLALSFWSFIVARKAAYRQKWLVFSGLFWGLALMTKTTAFYFFPVVGGIYAYDFITQKQARNVKTILAMINALVLGLSFIAWMRVSPLFPFLFQRSSDFAYSLSEISTGFAHIIGTNLYRIGKWLIIYFTPGLGILLLMSLKLKLKHSAKPLVAGFFLFTIPFLITGKLLSSRYFLPAVIWIIPLAALCLDGWLKVNRKIFYGLTALILFFSLRFTIPLYVNPGNTPFPNEDVVQYLTEWSSGYGIPEIRDYLYQEAKSKKIFVGTEGFFGTLPDGLYIYFHNSNLQNNLEIQGVGQPVTGIPDLLLEKAATQTVYLIVNEHRLSISPPDPRLELTAAYPRPRNAPSLLLFKVNP